MFSPDLKEFLSLAADHDAVPVSRCLLSDSLTPVLAFKRIDDGGTACLFESVVGGENVGRFSFLAVDPQLELSSFANTVTETENEQSRTFESENPLEEIRRRTAKVKVALLEGMPPFTGGAVGYAGYDTVRYVENLPNAPQDDRGLADMSFAFYDRMLVFDHITKTITVIALAWPKKFDTPEEAFDDACSRIDSMIQSLNKPDKPEKSLKCVDAVLPEGELPDFKSNFTQDQFEQACRDCILSLIHI